jgi:hypothetical protein
MYDTYLLSALVPPPRTKRYLHRKMQSEMMDVFAMIMKSVPPPDLYYTWFQPPMILEDALGRVIIVPLEYDWDVSSR